MTMRYEQPAIERRVEVSGPVIAGVAPVGSPVTPTPTWTVHDNLDGESS
jgi:hypothetical protein